MLNELKKVLMERNGLKAQLLLEVGEKLKYTNSMLFCSFIYNAFSFA